MSSRRRHTGNRENPPAGRCLGIFGLSIYTQERHLRDVFTKYGPLEDVQIVYDAQTGRSRGFAFVYYENKNDAAEVRENEFILLDLQLKLQFFCNFLGKRSL